MRLNGDAVEGEGDWAAAAAVLQALGGAGFGAALLQAAGRLAAVDHLSLFSFDAVLAPRLVLTASAGGSRVAAEAGRQYQAGRFHRFDPNMGHLQAGAAAGRPARGRPLLLRLAAEAVPDGDYRRAIYDRYDLGERLSLLHRAQSRWLVLNLYRDRRRGPCTEAEMARLDAGAGFLLAAAGRHLADGPEEADPAAGGHAGPHPADALAALERLLLAERLSRREAEACARALIGVTNLGIALDLGVKESTVATLRRRAYRKLGISSLQELFLLCLRRLAAADGDQASRSR
ncbi:LuxR C-terminal-related transcriptional regulator [Marinibaculum pumilum]|uniref:LuxR C-terminal-related transcriptional regulator n=1 Tax=Marinibaculum pumilum TaxID=1766165 RepID=A0ABV7L8H6_9PROT